MYFSTSSSHAPIWEPETVLELINPYRWRITCVGYVKTVPRRCRMPIAAERYSYLLDRLSKMDPSIAAKSNLLDNLADLLLCYHHGYQRYSVIAGWQKAIESHVRSNGKFKSSSNGFKDAEFEHETFTRFQEQFEEFMAQYAAFQEYQRQRERSTAGQKKGDTQDSKSANSNGASQSRTSNSSKKPPQPNVKEEQPGQDKAARGAEHRQTQAGSSYNRRQTAPPATKTWAEVWSKYTQDWEAIQSDVTNEDVKVPWPVKSGKFSDVTKSSVREFFTKGPLSGGNEVSASSMLSLMNEECKKWHPDKLFSRFNCLAEGEFRETTNMIIILVAELRNNARDQRNRQRAASV